MGHVNQPGDVPGRTVSRRRNIEAGVPQAWVLNHCHARPWSAGRSGDVEHATGSVGVVGRTVRVRTVVAGKDNCEERTARGLKHMSVEIELTVFNNKHGGATGRGVGHVGGEFNITAPKCVARYSSRIAASQRYGSRNLVARSNRVTVAMLRFLRVTAGTLTGRGWEGWFKVPRDLGVIGVRYRVIMHLFGAATGVGFRGKADVQSQIVSTAYGPGIRHGVAAIHAAGRRAVGVDTLSDATGSERQ